MGTFSYGSPARVQNFDDRTLLHLQLVILAKLRRGERFAFRAGAPDEFPHSVYWMSPDVPLYFEYTDSSRPAINVEWIKALTASTFQPDGLRIVPEPIDVAHSEQTARPATRLAPAR